MFLLLPKDQTFIFYLYLKKIRIIDHRNFNIFKLPSFNENTSSHVFVNHWFLGADVIGTRIMAGFSVYGTADNGLNDTGLQSIQGSSASTIYQMGE